MGINIHGNPMRIPWNSHGNPTEARCQGISVGLQWDFHGASMGLYCPYGTLLGLPLYFSPGYEFLWDFREPPMGFSWDFYGTPMEPLCGRGAPMGVPLCFHGMFSMLPWESHGVYIGPPYSSHGTSITLRDFDGTSMIIPLDFRAPAHGSPLGLPWDFRRDLGWDFHMAGTAINISWCFLGTTMVSPWEIRGKSTGLPWDLTPRVLP